MRKHKKNKRITRRSKTERRKGVGSTLLLLLLSKGSIIKRNDERGVTGAKTKRMNWDLRQNVGLE